MMTIMIVKIRNGKSSLNIKFLGGTPCGRRGGYPGEHPGPKTFTPSLRAQEDKVSFARTSMTRGGIGKTLCRKISG